VPRLFISISAPTLIALAALFAVIIGGNAQRVAADVGGVASDQPTFSRGDEITITVSAEDDDGDLTIISNLSGSRMAVEGCSGIGSNQTRGECDNSGLDAVSGNRSAYVTIDTNGLDRDDNSELLTVKLTLTASCSEATVVTISANQPGNVGPDDVTINCIPPTPTPTRTPSPTPTNTPLPTSTPFPTFTPQPTATPFFFSPPPVSQVLTTSSIGTTITPPSTGDGGLAE
jgi:hypothetical protein